MPKNLTYEKFLECDNARFAYNIRPTEKPKDYWVIYLKIRDEEGEYAMKKRFEKDMQDYEKQTATNQQEYKKYQQDCAKCKPAQQPATINYDKFIKKIGCYRCECKRTRLQAIQSGGPGYCCCGHTLQ